MRCGGGYGTPGTRRISGGGGRKGGGDERKILHFTGGMMIDIDIEIEGFIGFTKQDGICIDGVSLDEILDKTVGHLQPKWTDDNDPSDRKDIGTIEMKIRIRDNKD